MARKKKEPVVGENGVTHFDTGKSEVVKAFEPIVYASRGKALTLWVDDGKKKIQFNSNGKVGVYTAKSAEEVEQIEKTNLFKNGLEVWRVNGELKGEGKPVVSGPRSSKLQAPELPVDPDIQRTIAESNTQAKRPVSAE